MFTVLKWSIHHFRLERKLDANRGVSKSIVAKTIWPQSCNQPNKTTNSKSSHNDNKNNNNNDEGDSTLCQKLFSIKLLLLLKRLFRPPPTKKQKKKVFKQKFLKILPDWLSVQRRRCCCHPFSNDQLIVNERNFKRLFLYWFDDVIIAP